MITDASGDLLKAPVDALVNTVNTVGVMGKGIALQFKRAFPQMYAAYRADADRGLIVPGRMHVWDTGQMLPPRYIINFPTKRHWKTPSRLDDIEAGLQDLVRVVQEREIGSLAVPPLGCGNGGLDWAVVRPLIVEAFAAAPGVDVRLFAPEGPPAAATMVARAARPQMTPGRAALVEMVRAYTGQAFSAPGLIEVQKLMYFLQEDGQPLRLRFKAHHYGPYADNLRQVLSLVEGHFLMGFGDGSARVQQSEPLRVVKGAAAEAENVLAGSEYLSSIERVLATVEGFESPYGLELLATTHWLMTRERATSVDDLVSHVAAWSDRKRRMFSDQDLAAARTHLVERGWAQAA